MNDLNIPPGLSFDERAEWFMKQKRPTLFCGLDLGQSQDFSALAIVERSGDGVANYQFNCTHLQRWALRTSYPQIVEDTVLMMKSPQLQSGPGRPTLLVDGTGVGGAVVDLFKRAEHKSIFKPVIITAGNEITKSNGVYRVPKKILVGVIQVLLQSKRLRIVRSLPEAETLIKELQNFRAKTSDTGHASFGAGDDWRIGNNDDLVLALSMALWGGVDESGAWSMTRFRLR